MQKITIILSLLLLVSCNSEEETHELGDFFYLEFKPHGYCLHADPNCAKGAVYKNHYDIYDTNLLELLCSSCIDSQMREEIMRRKKQIHKENEILTDAYYNFKTLVGYKESYDFFREEALWNNNLKWLYEFMRLNNKPIYKGTYDQLFMEIGFDRNWTNPDISPIDYASNPSFEERYGKPRQIIPYNYNFINK